MEIYRTLTTGINTMPPMTVLTVEQRHQVAAFIREEIIRPNRPAACREVDREVAGTLPHPLYTLRELHKRANDPEQQVAKERGYYRDHGPVIINGYGDIVRNAAHIRLPNEVAVSYDLHTLNLIDVRTDGYLDMLTSQEFQQRPSSGVFPAGNPNRVLGGSSWIQNGRLQRSTNDSSRIPEDSSLKYFGHYLHEDEVILSYALGGRKILESPSAVREGENLSLSQHFRIAEGLPIQLGLVATDQTQFPSTGSPLVLEHEGAKVRFRITAKNPGQFRWVAVEGHLALEVPATTEPLEFALTRSVGDIPHAVDVKPLADLVTGGDRNWPSTYTVKGEVSPVEDEAYVMDTIPVPFLNEYNAWVRTTSLAFFADGRAVVTTYGGDVWMVSGLDRELSEVTWTRFAGGLFEAFGCEVIDGLV
jgi:hypothetical protein